MTSPDPMRPPPATRPTREQEALDEMAATRVRRGGAAFLSALALVLFLVGPWLELDAALAERENLLTGETRLLLPPLNDLRRVRAERGVAGLVDALDATMLEVEGRIARDSAVARFVRPRLQSAVLERLRYGDRQVLPGRDGRLFFSDDFAHVTGPGYLEPAERARLAREHVRHESECAGPLVDILALHEDLAARGVGFVFLPVPTKLTVEARDLVDGAGATPRNASTPELLDRLRAGGVDVFDPLPLLAALEAAGRRPYLRVDSHWNPQAFDGVARALAAHLAARYGVRPELRYHRFERIYDRLGDLGGLLGLESETDPRIVETVVTDAVDEPDGSALRTRRADGPVVLLGDSFSRLLLSHERRVGDANFAAELTFHLGVPVALRAENDAGEDFGRRIAWLGAKGFLADKKVVVFEVAERALSLAHWPAARLGPPT